MIAVGEETLKGRKVPIQIRAQALRQKVVSALPGSVLGFAMMADDGARGANEDDAGRPGDWRQADVERAIASAEQAGLASYRIEIAPDGTISIIVGEPGETAPPET